MSQFEELPSQVIYTLLATASTVIERVASTSGELTVPDTAAHQIMRHNLRLCNDS